MQSKFGKEKKIFRSDAFRVKYGTIDASKLSAIYINIESWVEPTRIINFDTNIRLTRKKIINELKTSLDKKYFNDSFIVDLDLRSSGLALNKKSFMFIEVTVYPKAVEKFNSDNLISKITEISSAVMAVVETDNYKFYSTK